MIIWSCKKLTYLRPMTSANFPLITAPTIPPIVIMEPKTEYCKIEGWMCNDKLNGYCYLFLIIIIPCPMHCMQKNMQTATYYEVKDIYVAKVYFGKVLWSRDLFHEYIIYVTFSTNFPLRTSATESPKSSIIPDSAGAEYPAWNEMQSQRTISEMEPYMCGLCSQKFAIWPQKIYTCLPPKQIDKLAYETPRKKIIIIKLDYFVVQWIVNWGKWVLKIVTILLCNEFLVTSILLKFVGGMFFIFFSFIETTFWHNRFIR